MHQKPCINEIEKFASDAYQNDPNTKHNVPDEDELLLEISDGRNNDDVQNEETGQSRDIFEECGIPPDVAKSMCRANIPKSGIFERPFDKKRIQYSSIQYSNRYIRSHNNRTRKKQNIKKGN